MSNLPHPLGDANPGDLFYPGSPIVTVADAPGTGGSRAVEYGEDALSLAMNRSAYALGKNDEYIQERLEALLAKPTFVSFTPAAGNGASYTFTGLNIFVGDSSYLPSTDTVIQSLIRVLDSNYAEATDTAGNVVVVKEIRNAGDTASIVGDPTGAGGDENGFYTAPIIRFKTVNPRTRATVSSSYTLPDGAAVNFMVGQSYMLDSLATVGQEYYLRDMLMPLQRTLHRIPAGVLLQDGTRKLTGDLDADAHALLNVTEITGAPAVDLSIASTDELLLSDSRVTDIPFTEPTVTDVHSESGLVSSILRAINTNSRTWAAFGGNRVIERGGDLTFTDGTGLFALPSGMRVMLNGEELPVSGSYTVTSDVEKVAVINSSGVLTEKDPSSVLGSDLVVAYYYYDDAGSNTFTTKYDARWTLSGRTDTLSVTVGSAPGVDFTSLPKAIDMLVAFHEIGLVAGLSPWRNEIEICGEVELTAQLNLPQMNIVFKGYGVSSSYINASASFNVASSLILGNTLSTYKFLDIGFKWKNTTSQSAGYAALRNLGSRSVISRCQFYTGTGKFYNAIRWENSAVDSVVDTCIADIGGSFCDTGVYTSGAIFRNIVVSGTPADYVFNAPSKRNRFEKCVAGSVGTKVTKGIRAGASSVVDQCFIYVTAEGVTFDPYEADDDTLNLTLRDSTIYGSVTTKGLYVIPTGSTGIGKIIAHHNTFRSVLYSLYVNASSLDADSQIFLFKNTLKGSRPLFLEGGAKDVYFLNNTVDASMSSSGETPLFQTASGAGNLYIEGNTVKVTWADPDFAPSASLIVDEGIRQVKTIHSNTITCALGVGALDGGEYVFSLSSGTSIKNNTVDVGTRNGLLDSAGNSDYIIGGNTITNWAAYGIRLSGDASSNIGHIIYKNKISTTISKSSVGIEIGYGKNIIIDKNKISGTSNGIFAFGQLVLLKITDNVIYDAATDPNILGTYANTLWGIYVIASGGGSLLSNAIIVSGNIVHNVGFSTTKHVVGISCVGAAEDANGIVSNNYVGKLKTGASKDTSYYEIESPFVVSGNVAEDFYFSTSPLYMYKQVSQAPAIFGLNYAIFKGAYAGRVVKGVDAIIDGPVILGNQVGPITGAGAGSVAISNTVGVAMVGNVSATLNIGTSGGTESGGTVVGNAIITPGNIYKANHSIDNNPTAAS